MSYKYTISIKEPGKATRRASATVKSDAALKSACNLLLRPGSKVSILRRERVAAKKRTRR